VDIQCVHTMHVIVQGRQNKFHSKQVQYLFTYEIFHDFNSSLATSKLESKQNVRRPSYFTLHTQNKKQKQKKITVTKFEHFF
jgi:hypothetical protein